MYGSIYVVLLAMVVLSCEMNAPNKMKTDFTNPTIKRINTSQKVVALTFDDGPNFPYTEELLNILSEMDAKATFFLVGKNVELAPELARQIHKKGHEIGNHSYRHIRATTLQYEQLFTEITYGAAAISLATGVEPTLFRAPFGSVSKELVGLVKDNKYTLVGWSVHADDWNEHSAEEIATTVLKRVKPGAIVLLHDGSGTSAGVNKSATIEATRIILQELKKRGYRFLTVTELLRLVSSKAA